MSTYGPVRNEHLERELGGTWVSCNECPMFRIYDFHYFFCRQLGDQSKPDSWRSFEGWKQLNRTAFKRDRGERAPCEIDEPAP